MKKTSARNAENRKRTVRVGTMTSTTRKRKIGYFAPIARILTVQENAKTRVLMTKRINRRSAAERTEDGSKQQSDYRRSRVPTDSQ